MHDVNGIVKPCRIHCGRLGEGEMAIVNIAFSKIAISYPDYEHIFYEIINTENILKIIYICFVVLSNLSLLV